MRLRAVTSPPQAVGNIDIPENSERSKPKAVKVGATAQIKKEGNSMANVENITDEQLAAMINELTPDKRAAVLVYMQGMIAGAQLQQGA